MTQNLQLNDQLYWQRRGLTSSLAKSKQIIGAHFQTIFSTIFLFFVVPQYSNRLNYIKDIRPAIYFNNQKIIAYHL